MTPGVNLVFDPILGMGYTPRATPTTLNATLSDTLSGTDSVSAVLSPVTRPGRIMGFLSMVNCIVAVKATSSPDPYLKFQVLRNGTVLSEQVIVNSGTGSAIEHTLVFYEDLKFLSGAVVNSGDVYELKVSQIPGGGAGTDTATVTGTITLIYQEV